MLLMLPISGISSDNGSEIVSYFGSKITKEAFDRYLQSRMEELNIPGLSVAVVNDGEVVHQQTLGYANVEKKLPVTKNTIFEGASISKSVFAFFVMKYVEAGKLELDRPLYQYLPYPDISHDKRYKQITARMVLSHQSGFPNWREDEADKKLKIKFDPGTGYEYSGEGYQYLAMVLKHIKGTDWKGLEAAFQDKVADPLDMEHTVFVQNPYTRKRKAEPYDENGKWINWKNDYWYKKGDSVFGAAYSIHTEPVDFAKWMIAVMDKEGLTEASYQELLKPHSTISSGIIDVFYCLGFVTPAVPFIETDIYMHSGNNEGFTCWYALDTKKDWGFVLFTNSEYGEQLGNDLFDFLSIGPHLTWIYFIGGAIVICVLIGVGILIRFIIRIVKRKLA